MRCRIRFYKWILFVVVEMLCMTPSWASPSQTINFPQAVSIATASNSSIKMSESQVAAAHAAILESRGHALPKLDLEWHAARSDNPSNVFAYKLAQGNATFADFGFEQFSGPASLELKPDALNNPRDYNHFNTGVVLNIPIYSGGKNWAEAKRGEYLLLASRQGSVKARAELTYHLFQVYEGIRTADAVIQVTKAHLQASNVILSYTQSLLTQSLVIQSDVLMAENFRRRAQASLQTAIIEREAQLHNFAILLGKPKQNYKPGIQFKPTIKLSKSWLAKQALLSNAELQALKLRSDAEHEKIHMIEARSKPQIQFQVRHDWNSRNPIPERGSSTALLSMNWNVFNSGEQFGATQKAAAEYQQANLEYQANVERLLLAINSAVHNAEIAELQIESARVIARREAEIARDLKNLYGQNATPLGQLLEAQTQLTAARIQEHVAQYQLSLIKAQLLTLTGQFRV